MSGLFYAPMKTVADKTPAVTAMEHDWVLSRSLLGGTRAMRAAGPALLPKWPNEDQQSYSNRLATAVLFPAYKRTVTTLTAKPFSKPITVGDDVPAKFAPWLEDIDRQGRNLDVFAADLMQSALGYGICGIFIDSPNAAGVALSATGVPTQADEAAAGIRPYLVHIHPWQLLGWRAEHHNGTWDLQQLRFMECIEEPDGPYGTKEVNQVRVLEPGRWETWRKSGTDQQWALYEEGATNLKKVPFVPVYAGRTGYMQAEPPLIEVANLNVAHWQSASDQQTILHAARVPILAMMGVDQDTPAITVGASTAVRLPVGGDMKFVEHSGQAIGSGMNDLDKLEERMRQAGAELLVVQPGRVTATQIHNENSIGMSALQRVTQGLEDALDQALQFMADFAGEAEGGHLKLFNDYGAVQLAESGTDVLMRMTQAGNLSNETLFLEFQRRGIVSPDVEWAAEVERIDAQGPSLGSMGVPAASQAA